ncbi:hypothetical protein FQA39_LY09542 [Lamprigera yunnana]|nr:hypothetical protein FQA39_LY09542 [Lamprigera yunnana]
MRQLISILILSSVLKVNTLQSEGRESVSIRAVIQCVSTMDYACILDYVENIADKSYTNLLKDADISARSSLNEVGRKKEDEELPSSLLTSITSILSELPELIRSTFGVLLSGDVDEKSADENEAAESDDEEEDADEDDDDEEEDTAEIDNSVVKKCKNGTSCSKTENRLRVSNHKSNKNVGVSRKKKKKEKIKAIIKVVVVVIVLVVKLLILLKLLAAKLQIKFLLIAVINLIINIARFWWDLKKGGHPQKVIYYEHAQHQHHYDGGDDWHSSGPESYWSRSSEKVDDKAAQDLAYSKQAPYGTKYTRVEDKPNFSWNPWSQAERSL